MTALALHTVKVDDLHPHPRNYRTHPADQLEHIRASIERHGQYRNVVVANDNTILAGHGVVLALRALGRDSVEVYRVDVGPDDPRAHQILTGDNEIARLGDVDDRALTELLRDLASEDLELLLGTGFDQGQLAALALVTRPSSELLGTDEAAEWVGLPSFDPVGRDNDPSITVKFLSVGDRERFVEQVLGPEYPFVRKYDSSWTCWWPEKRHNDLSSVKFQPGDG